VVNANKGDNMFLQIWNIVAPVVAVIGTVSIIWVLMLSFLPDRIWWQ
jgi:hypothetical protein